MSNWMRRLVFLSWALSPYNNMVSTVLRHLETGIIIPSATHKEVSCRCLYLLCATRFLAQTSRSVNEYVPLFFLNSLTTIIL